MTARRPTTRRRKRRLLAGNRVYLLLLAGLVGALVAMALGPLQSYTAAADRADRLESSRDQLAQEVDRLEERRERLHDLEEIELIARTELGLVRPGEVPYVVVTPDEEPGQLRPDDEPAEPADGPWYRRLGRWLGTLFD